MSAVQIMTLITVDFGNCGEISTSFISSSNDKWTVLRQRKTDSQIFKFSLEITLVSRGDEKNQPIKAAVHTDKKVEFVEFPLGETKSISCSTDGLQITYRLSDICHHPNNLMCDLLTYVKNHHDFQLKASDGKIFHISKVLLMSRSKVFNEILTQDTKENQKNEMELDASSSVLEDFVAFLKTDRVPNMSKNAIALGLLAQDFKTSKLWNMVESYLESNTTKK